MDKKLMSVSIMTKGGNGVTFADTPTTSDGTSAARSLAQHTVIDAEGTVGDSEEAQRIIIPYMAIDNAKTMVQFTSSTAHADANCKVQTPPAEELESGTLKITNGSTEDIQVYLKLDAPATYSGIEFTEIPGTSGWYSGTITGIEEGASFTLEGIPDGTEFRVGQLSGTVPAAVTYVNPK